MTKDIFKYITVNPSKSTSLYKEKGSKFIGYIFCINSDKDIDKALAHIKKQHPQARHICYGYSYGIVEKTTKANDDGEPNNSAGMPIYNQIQSYNLDNVIIAVVRYFGGTKLGVSGLINAYKTAAKQIIEDSEIIEVELQFKGEISCTYDQLSSVYHYLNTHPNAIVNQKMLEKCTIVVEFPLRNQKEVLQFFDSQPYDFSLIES